MFPVIIVSPSLHSVHFKQLQHKVQCGKWPEDGDGWLNEKQFPDMA